MILLISEQKDPVTNNVIDWLLHYDCPFNRVNREELLELRAFRINNSNETIDFEGQRFGQEIKKVWHHRNRPTFIPKNLKRNRLIHHYLKKEEDSLVKSMESFLQKKIDYTGSYLKEAENYKLDHLQLAKEAGFLIPDTLVTSSKEKLVGFFEEKKKVICKVLRYPANIETKDQLLEDVGTVLVTKDKIDELATSFFPTFLQEYIEKEFEVRTYFFNEEIYSMAIFSQTNEQTQVDFRNYDEERPNRNVPFSLPNEIVNKLLVFKELAGLTSGSVDFIFTPNSEFIFLEVNPMGQFQWVSKRCNYYIEQKIAEQLIA